MDIHLVLKIDRWPRILSSLYSARAALVYFTVRSLLKDWKKNMNITLKWAFQLFHGVIDLIIKSKGHCWRIMTEFSEAQKKILQCLPEAAPFYSSA